LLPAGHSHRRTSGGEAGADVAEDLGQKLYPKKRRGGYQVRPFVPVSKRDESRPSLPGKCWGSHRPNLDWSQIDVDHLDRVDAACRYRCSEHRNPVHCIYDLQR
jgi:hypothetical protein